MACSCNCIGGKTPEPAGIAMRTVRPLLTFAYRRGEGCSTTQTGHSLCVDFEWQLYTSING
jgi:hypothetical protein